MALSELARRRLGLVIDLIKEDRVRNHFSFGRWVGTDWKGATDLSCGTSACVGGWATTIPEFRLEGLYFAGLGPNQSRYYVVALLTMSMNEPIYCQNALAKVLDISVEDASCLFCPDQHRWTALGTTVISPDSNATVDEVRKHFEEFLRVDGQWIFYEPQHIQ